MSQREQKELPTFIFKSKKSFTFIHFLRILKSNLGLVVLVPTLAGGAYQLWLLLSIKLSFIRFFSVAQVISDGLMIIGGFLGLMLALLYIFLLSYFVPEIKEKNSNTIKIIKIIYMISLIFLFFYLKPGDKALKTPTDISLLLYFKLNLIILTCYTSYSLGHIIYLFFRKNKNLKYNDYLKNIYIKYKKRIEQLFIFIILVILLIFAQSVEKLLDNINKYDDLNNFKIIEQTFKESNLLNSQPQVVYYNKDYLFLDLHIEKNCRCDNHIICDQEKIYKNIKWTEHQYIVLDGKKVLEVYE